MSQLLALADQLTCNIVVTPTSVAVAHANATDMLRREGVPEAVIMTSLGMVFNAIAADIRSEVEAEEV